MAKTYARSLHQIVWKLPIPPGGLPPDVEPDVAVWVDVAKIEAAWPQDYLYIEPGGRGRSQMPERYDQFGKWFKRGHVVEMPSICICDGTLGFSDGRHRFAWLRDKGAKRIQVAACPDCAANVARKFGVP